MRRRSEFDLLVDDLLAFSRNRSRMVKALAAGQAICELPRSCRRQSGWDALIAETAELRKSLVASGRPLLRPDELRVQHQREQVARAREMLKSLISAGRLSAIGVMKAESRLNRVEAMLP